MKEEGLETDWYKNGQKREETTYKDGKEISEQEWNDDGSLKNLSRLRQPFGHYPYLTSLTVTNKPISHP